MKSQLVKNYEKILVNSRKSYEQTALQVYNSLVENFSQTFFVGGAVRDLILGRPLTDVDLATAGRTSEVLALLRALGYELDLKGIRFGVISVKARSKWIEIASFRKEHYGNSRFPKISFTSSKALDAKRRDFTINSLYFQGKTGVLYDPFGGIKDLRSKTVKLIGNPDKRLREDPLRIVRAYRFARQLNFRFDPKTEQAINSNFHLLRDITVKKIKKEIAKSDTAPTKKYLTNIFKKLLQK